MTEWAAHVPAWLPLLAVVAVALTVAWRRHTRDTDDGQVERSDRDHDGVSSP